ncbi:hypothetical protein Nepgr_029615 [Nepenthes gracilis]|uniref:Phototropic-responsive NPH3 family protein n=1 Tax=Nepenthes gracilis TaxID=150966 RepID=A0AAD3TEC9_NEPGR|nr:hypothetical protein Nepgr_029615 [Nepenthes gracilis]
MGMVTMGDLKPSISGKRAFRASSSTRHTNECSRCRKAQSLLSLTRLTVARGCAVAAVLVPTCINCCVVLNAIAGPISDVSSDLTIEVGPATFALHKFPLVSRSGRIRKLLLEAKDAKVTRISIPSMPGGAETFELAAKFCYGINVDITLSNVATLRCTAHFLEMTEEFAEKNLVTRTEAYIKEIVLPSISNSISVLHNCENLLPTAEDINLVSRIVAAIASNACKEQLSSGLSKLEHNVPDQKTAEMPADWWGTSLKVLNLDFFQRVLSAVKSKGLKQDLISRILINYAHSSIQGLVAGNPVKANSNHSMDLEVQKKQRVIVEALVNLLPTQSRKSSVPMAFLSSLLKSAIASSASTSCKSDLERRIGLQLDQAILEDILIPANYSNGNNHNHSPMYDTDTVLRIFSIFLNLDEDDDDINNFRDEREMMYDFDGPNSPQQSSILKVSKLLDNYLAEIAVDSNLTPSKFIALAELLPDHARLVTDGLYRAVDIFLKASKPVSPFLLGNSIGKVHPNVKDSERYRLCKTINCQQLSQEACSHAAQNERLPVQMAVQVLYFEQIRLRNAMNGGHNQFFFGSVNGHFPQRSSSGAGSGAISPRDNYASVRRENRELKLEVARMRLRLTDLEKDHVSMKQELVRSHPANKLFKSFARKMKKLNFIFRMNNTKPSLASKTNSESRFFFQRRRHHSIS